MPRGWSVDVIDQHNQRLISKSFTQVSFHVTSKLSHQKKKRKKNENPPPPVKAIPARGKT
jgi:hypothetical protein